MMQLWRLAAWKLHAEAARRSMIGMILPRKLITPSM